MLEKYEYSTDLKVYILEVDNYLAKKCFFMNLENVKRYREPYGCIQHLERSILLRRGNTGNTEHGIHSPWTNQASWIKTKI